MSRLTSASLVTIVSVACAIGSPAARGALYYVNDNSTINDQWCTAPGDDANDGLTPATPKATAQAILDSYNLEPGDVVRVDTGTYVLSADISVAVGDSGSETSYVQFLGSPNGTVIDRNSADAGASCVQFDGGSYIEFSQLVFQSGQDAFYSNAPDTYCSIVNSIIDGSARYGMYLGSDARRSHFTLRSCVLQYCGSAGGYLNNLWSGPPTMSCYNCTFYGNPTSITVQYYPTSYGPAVFKNNIVYASGSGNSCFSCKPVESDYNDLFTTDGAQVHASAADLIEWRSMTGLDVNSIDQDPVFTGHSHVSFESPCIDAGDPDYAPAEGETDIDGEPRIMRSRIDIGADEVPPFAVTEWRSVRTHDAGQIHGGPYVLAIALDHLSDAGTSEPRLGGIRRVEVDFNDVVALMGTVYAENLTDGGTIAADDAYVTNNGDGTSTLVIEFDVDKLPDMKCYRIDLAGNIPDFFGDTDCRMVALEGDVDGDRNVTLTDFLRAKDNNAQPVTEGDNHRSDLDVDGNITLTDYLKAKDLNAHTVTCP